MHRIAERPKPANGESGTALTTTVEEYSWQVVCLCQEGDCMGWGIGSVKMRMRSRASSKRIAFCPVTN